MLRLLLLAAVLSVAPTSPKYVTGEQHWGYRRLVSAPDASFDVEQRQNDSSQTNSVEPTCLGYLIGIGTQKGGTTAAWAYLRHSTHPMLKVSDQKEIGFWDHLHTWYKGCTLGDYQMLVNSSTAEPSLSTLPVCPVPGASGYMWAMSSNRLRSSSNCAIKQLLLDRAAAAANASNSSLSAVTPAYESLVFRCSQTTAIDAPKVPWWRFWRRWKSRGSRICVPESAVPGLLGNSSDNSSTRMADIATAAANPLFQVDITPSYLYHFAAPLWLKSYLPEARILVILREPVSRAISNFNMKWQKKREAEIRAGNLTLANATSQQREAAWVAELSTNATQQMQELSTCYHNHGVTALQQPELAACMGMQQPYGPAHDDALWSDAMVWQGIYADGLERWFNLFPAKQVLIWVSEDFKQEPAAHVRELVAWLGLNPEQLDPRFWPGAKPLKPVHVRDYEGSAPAHLLQQMYEFYAPHNERLFRVLASKGFAGVANRMRELWVQPQPQPS